MTHKIIAVFGGGNVHEETEEWQAACRGAKTAGGITIGILPGDRKTSPPNSSVDIAIFTGMGDARNIINVKSCQAAIAVGGAYGTLSEIALALKSGCPIVLLNSWSIADRAGAQKNIIRAATPEEAVKKAIAAGED